MIALRDVTVCYGGKTVLSHFSLELPTHGVVCLTGPSGCGKTTAMRVLAGLIRPNSGTVEGMENVRLTMVFQEDRLLPWHSALENASLVGEERDARHWLEALGLGDALQKRPHALSGGMRRRVALARALTRGGDLLLLDEPFNGVDDANVELALRLLEPFAARAPILCVTHDLTLAHKWGNRVIALHAPENEKSAE